MSYLSYLQSEVAEKRAQLIRLQASLTKLDGLQSEFLHNKQLIDQPELSPRYMGRGISELFPKYTRRYEDGLSRFIDQSVKLRTYDNGK
ncbi:hypothetical protein [Guptibacillus hwajinpoensis]|uniref:hypothetical protein n=1 Tax=Guptibacillus hwajinpoensis TaxID=208199 RepID=UPI00273D50C7|nr:hypothetical protein [Pseudalkalibacillus hwajinpoensis]WLR59189.1 hypothetical protein LC071_18920 [Pseudalkalibacillus hwajinpoensis]